MPSAEVTQNELVASTGLALAANQSSAVPVLGQPNQPTAGVEAVEVDLSVAGTAAGTTVWLYDADDGQPTDPTLVTTATGNTIQTEVPLSAVGALTVIASAAVTVHLDVLGYYDSSSAIQAGSSYEQNRPALLAGLAGHVVIDLAGISELQAHPGIEYEGLCW